MTEKRENERPEKKDLICINDTGRKTDTRERMRKKSGKTKGHPVQASCSPCQSSVGYGNTKSGLWKHQNNPACFKRVKSLRNAETGYYTKEEERKERGQMVRRRKRPN